VFEAHHSADYDEVWTGETSGTYGPVVTASKELYTTRRITSTTDKLNGHLCKTENG